MDAQMSQKEIDRLAVQVKRAGRRYSDNSLGQESDEEEGQADKNNDQLLARVDRKSIANPVQKQLAKLEMAAYI